MRLVVFLFALAGARLALADGARWLACTPTNVRARRGDRLVLAAIPIVDRAGEKLSDWQAAARIDSGAGVFDVFLGADTSVWSDRAAASSLPAVIIDIQRHQTIIARGVQVMDDPRRLLILPLFGAGGATEPLFEVRVDAWPEHFRAPFPATIQRAGDSVRKGTVRWIAPAGRWTHDRSDGEPANCSWSWTHNGQPIAPPDGLRGANSRATLVLPDFDPARDCGTYIVHFEYGGASGSAELLQAFTVTGAQ